MDTVEALVCSEPGILSLERRPPPSIAPDEVLVRPRRVGICGTDYHIFEGKHPYLQYPRVMGHELAVEVVEGGSRFGTGSICVVNPYLSCGDCGACRSGKPNCCERIAVLGVHRDGGMAGLLALPEGNLVDARGLGADACACVEFLAIGAHAVRRGAVTSGDRVLVVGAGPIGLGVALFARLSGGDVSVLDLDPERCEAATVITGAPAGRTAANESFDVVFDATGNSKAMEKGFDHVSHGGRLVLVSVVTDAISFSDPDFHRKEMTLLGSRNATAEDFERVITAIGSGDVPVSNLITHRTTLSGAAADLPRWATTKTGLIKALIEIEP